MTQRTKQRQATATRVCTQAYHACLPRMPTAHACTHVYTHICTHGCCLHTCLHVCLHRCIYTRLLTHLHTLHTHMYTYLHTPHTHPHTCLYIYPQACLLGISTPHTHTHMTMCMAKHISERMCTHRQGLLSCLTETVTAERGQGNAMDYTIMDLTIIVR